eukprot:TRINITY_DN27190_c0_g1_i1.p1 TRINITY_DN27190_c0_g1~~TRINITY_DN27190_c0_g1_i1.p1  ORF type:complete len:645 (-),score=58.49 TRINITY_DN27190_c0_g1_i1:153-2087(-)
MAGFCIWCGLRPKLMYQGTLSDYCGFTCTKSHKSNSGNCVACKTQPIDPNFAQNKVCGQQCLNRWVASVPGGGGGGTSPPTAGHPGAPAPAPQPQPHGHFHWPWHGKKNQPTQQGQAPSQAPPVPGNQGAAPPFPQTPQQPACPWCQVRPVHFDGTRAHATCGLHCRNMQNSGSTTCLHCRTNPEQPQFGKFCSLPCRLSYAEKTPHNYLIHQLNLKGLPQPQPQPGSPPPQLSGPNMTNAFPQHNLPSPQQHQPPPLPPQHHHMSPPHPHSHSPPPGVANVAAQMVHQPAAPPPGPPPGPTDDQFFHAVGKADWNFLKKHKGDLGKVKANKWDKTVVHIAAEKGDVKLLKFLIEEAKLAAAEHPKSGNTLLHYGHEHEEVIKYCLNTLKIDQGQRNKRGLIARDLAPPGLKHLFKPKTVIKLNTSIAQKSTLFPSIMCTTDGHEKVAKGSDEFKMIEKMMNVSVLDVHGSFKARPYDFYKIDCILRYWNPQKWQDCTAEPPQPPQYRYFFHGTSKDVCKLIESGQFMQSSQGTFGPGVYLAENSSVAHLFAKTKDNGDGYCYMLVVLANVGDMYKGLENADTSDKKKSRDLVCQKHKHVNTVQNMNPKGYKEFVIFKEVRAYPCYRIRYKVVDDAGAEIDGPY